MREGDGLSVDGEAAGDSPPRARLRRRMWPARRAELIAYGCGYRLGEDGEDSLTQVASLHLDLGSYLTDEERAVWETLDRDAWWHWWHRGWQDQAESEL